MKYIDWKYLKDCHCEYSNDTILRTITCIEATIVGRLVKKDFPFEETANSLLVWLNKRVNGVEIDNVIFHNPATIILWKDGTKTVVKCQEGDTYDKEKGFLLCYLKGIIGNKTLLKELDRWVYNESENNSNNK